jgi:hypothetical protein
MVSASVVGGAVVVEPDVVVVDDVESKEHASGDVQLSPLLAAV